MTEAVSTRRIVIFGGYGVFGGKLAEALLRSARFEVVVAGRSLEKAERFCAQIGGTPAVLDRETADFPAALAALSPFITVDAAGPFQAYDGNLYRVAEAALQAGSHYLDLSDDGAFTRGIRELDRQAKAAGCAVLSGVSSVPALSSAAVETLKTDFTRLDLIESTILPGNRAPRGLSVIRAILAQTGRPLVITRDGIRQTVSGWSGLEKRRLGPAGDGGLPPRWSSFIGAPDLILFPDHYGARTVLFRAGLELPLMHLGLWGLSWLVRLRLIRSLEPAAKTFQWIADRLKPFGTDRGGMEVRVCGSDLQGRPVSRCWTLIAEAGDGPHIPAVAATVLCERISGGAVQPGARPCLGEFSSGDANAAMAHLNVRTFVSTDTRPTLFQQVLGRTFDDLPQPIQALHTVYDRRHWAGRAKVTRGRSRLGNLLCRMVGFPPEAAETLVSVTIDRHQDGETWRRCFGGYSFTSHMCARDDTGSGHIRERFGLLRFAIDLRLEDGQLHYPVRRGTLLGLPLPKWLLPVSAAAEFVTDDRFHFDVKLSLPGIGLLVHYQGWLEEARPEDLHPSGAVHAEALNCRPGVTLRRTERAEP